MKMMKRTLALLLVLAMLFGMAACGKQPEEKLQAPQQAQPVQEQEQEQEYSREDMELIVDLIGDGENAGDMTDQELEQLVDRLVQDATEEEAAGIVNLGNTGSKAEQPSVDVSGNKNAYNENGEMTKPFDQVYPELIEQEQVKFSGESILIKLKKNTLTDGLKAAGIGALEAIVPLQGAAWYEAKLTQGTAPKAAIEAVRGLDEVLLAEYNYEIETAALDDYKHFDKDKDEEFKKNGHNKDQWHFHHCGIVDGYDKMETEGGSDSVIVAVIDSGVDYDHEDLKDNMWVNAGEIPDNGIDDDGNGYTDDYYGVDIVAGYGNGDDTNGHGTHVAGIIAARNNNTGVLGIAYNVKIMSVKAAMHNGTLNQADIARAVLYAYEMGAEVINMSFGGTACSIAVQDALATAYTRCVLVASAGNNGAENEGMFAIPNYPAALTYVLGVMSVDQYGVESAFTNWDVKAFNGVEYELYAPGENIMSTLPGNRYGYLSGTSMAAPVVSAFAAILRSEFSDRDKYPTKFIYGQLSSTSGNHADCLDPEKHGPHNLPQIANLHDALTKLPKPEVNLQEYALFDDPKYSEKNNGDGVIDAGETIALGLTLRNRWGMSENTLVTVDTKSSISGMEDPYFTIKNPTVDYGSVGTYSTQDCGRIYTDELLTGWENPFIIEVADNCPNDYRFTLNVTITCENALDEADTATYTTWGKVDENVRSGYILPSIIEKDMVLTPDNLYIIPNATIITEGVTVRVEPGTHIQFWSDDADDPYADSYIAYLVVNGKFLVEGTKEDPVYIYPSQLMDRYGVEIGSTDKGYVSLKYADVTNFVYQEDHTGTRNHIDLADHCTFRNNYADFLCYRGLTGGVVGWWTMHNASIGEMNARDCVFYKLGVPNGLHLEGSYDRCIFTQCGIRFNLDDNRLYSYTDCVFLGNSLVDQTNPELYMNSSTSLRPEVLPNLDELKAYDSRLKVFYRPETGTTYVRWFDGGEWTRGEVYADYLKEAFGGDYAKIETAEEKAWIAAQEGVGGQVGVHWDTARDCYVWHDGTPVDLELFPNMAARIGESYNEYYIHISLDAISADSPKGEFVYSHTNYLLYELPGQILPEDIVFPEYAIVLDPEATYQLSPRSAPAQLTLKDFVYESSDESVVTVSDTGLVTPVGLGTADVWVWSLDKAVRNHVTVAVKDYVALESLTLSASAQLLAAGEKLTLDCTLAPANTTRRNVVYTSSDETVATVDAGGIVTGVSAGKVTVTATCEGFTDTVELTVYPKATSLQLESVAIGAVLADGAVALPRVILSQGAEADLSWRSTDETVAVIQDGKAVLKGLGTTSLIVTDSRSGLSAACWVMVTETVGVRIRDMQMVSANDGHYVLLEDGSLYHWDNTYRRTPTCIATGVKAFSADSATCALLMEDGTIQYGYNQAYPGWHWSYDFFQGREIIDLAYNYHNIPGGNFYVVTAEGNAYAWGDNNGNGQLGVGFAGSVDEPALINLENVVDVQAYYHNALFLTGDGELYAAGSLGNATTALTPVRIDTGVSRLLDRYYSNEAVYLTDKGQLKRIVFEDSSKLHPADISGLDRIATHGLDWCIGIKDGKAYIYEGSNKTPTCVPGITDAVDVFTYGGSYYIATENGQLFGFGSNNIHSNDMAGATTEDPVTVPVLIPLVPLPEEAVFVTETNLEEVTLQESVLRLALNKQLSAATGKLYADGVQVAADIRISDHNRLLISRTKGFTQGVNYELVFNAGGIHAVGNITNTEELRIAFTYSPAEPAVPENPEEAPVIYESILDETVQRILTPESLIEKMDAFIAQTQYNPKFNGNAILNPVSTDFEVSHWLRVQASGVAVGTYKEIPLGGNYWGSTNDRAIGLQMIDYTDFPNYARLMYAPYLTEAPENTFPFVTSVKLFNKEGEEVTVVGNEEITFRITFNRDMDTSIPLLVRFGSAFPYGDYEFEGEYVDARIWEGTYTLNTLIENGYQYFTISNGCSATDDLPLQMDQARFFFEIDTTAAQALIMQGTPTDTGIQLNWTQDDFDTLMGYNVYRATKEDGLYTRLNDVTIPADTMEFFDDTVEPGVVYYYNFTVVKTDLTESEPSGKISLMSKDTMAPNIYHSPVGSAFTGANLVITATVTDNLNIAYANLYYRTVGADQWKTVRMNKLNDKYSAIITAENVTLEGIEYYIEAFDGVSYTYKGSAETPFKIAVQEAIGADALGDVDGDGVITNRDALVLLYAINDKYNLTAEEYARADLNGDGDLWAAEALRILQYVSGVVGSVKM